MSRGRQSTACTGSGVKGIWLVGRHPLGRFPERHNAPRHVWHRVSVHTFKEDRLADGPDRPGQNERYHERNFRQEDRVNVFSYKFAHGSQGTIKTWDRATGDRGPLSVRDGGMVGWRRPKGPKSETLEPRLMRLFLDRYPGHRLTRCPDARRPGSPCRWPSDRVIGGSIGLVLSMSHTRTRTRGGLEFGR